VSQGEEGAAGGSGRGSSFKSKKRATFGITVALPPPDRPKEAAGDTSLGDRGGCEVSPETTAPAAATDSLSSPTSGTRRSVNPVTGRKEKGEDTEPVRGEGHTAWYLHTAPSVYSFRPAGLEESIDAPCTKVHYSGDTFGEDEIFLGGEGRSFYRR
jgi:hypothetical protein